MGGTVGCCVSGDHDGKDQDENPNRPMETHENDNSVLSTAFQLNKTLKSSQLTEEQKKFNQMQEFNKQVFGANINDLTDENADLEIKYLNQEEKETNQQMTLQSIKKHINDWFNLQLSVDWHVFETGNEFISMQVKKGFAGLRKDLPLIQVQFSFSKDFELLPLMRAVLNPQYKQVWDSGVIQMTNLQNINTNWIIQYEKRYSLDMELNGKIDEQFKGQQDSLEKVCIFRDPENKQKYTVFYSSVIPFETLDLKQTGDDCQRYTSVLGVYIFERTEQDGNERIKMTHLTQSCANEQLLDKTQNKKHNLQQLADKYCKQKHDLDLYMTKEIERQKVIQSQLKQN